MRNFNYKKAVQALNFFAIAAGGTLNKMKGLKLLFLSDRFHLRRYGRTISGDTYFAFKLGPVPGNTLDILDNTNFASSKWLEYGNEFISPENNLFFSSKSGLATKVFSESDKRTLDKIFIEYGQLSEFQLSDLSHLFPEWQRFQKQLEQDNRQRFEMDMSDFFREDFTGTDLYKAELEDLELMESLFTRREKFFN